MISVIISSANRNQLANISENIAQTIGVPYEIIAFFNESGQRGICDVYNEGLGKANYDILCFTHEDLIFNTDNWGQVVLARFASNEKLGLLGVAGSKYKPLSPSSWFSWVEQANRINIIQRYKYERAKPKLLYSNPLNESFSLVAAVDGVWFCTRKHIAQEIRFDSEMLKGFHGYDVDFSLNVGRKWDIAVSYEILIDHFSEGRYDRKWFESAMLIHKKWNHLLPRRMGLTLNMKEARICEKKAFLFLIDKMQEFGYSKKDMYKVLWQSKLYKILGWWRLFPLCYKIYKVISAGDSSKMYHKTPSL